MVAGVLSSPGAPCGGVQLESGATTACVARVAHITRSHAAARSRLLTFAQWNVASIVPQATRAAGRDRLEYPR